MSMPDIKYDLHDAVIVSAKYTDNNSLKLTVKLQGAMYEGSPNVMLIFSGIVSDKVKSFVEQLVADYQDLGEPDFLGARIDCFQYDERKESTFKNRHFFLDVDGLVVRIHCHDFDIID